MTTILIGDIGGTNARLQLGSLTDDTFTPIKTETLATKDYPNFLLLFKSFLQDAVPRVGILAIAGVAEGISARFVNQPWDPIFCTSEEIQNATGIEKLVFLNDFEAAGYGCLALPSDKFIQLNEGVAPSDFKRKVVMGPGTGLGEALLTWSGSRFQCWAGEGGHSDFAPHTEEEWEFSKFMMNLVQTSDEYEKFRPCEGVSFEVCMAGVGAFHIYDFFRGRYPELADAEFDNLWESDKSNKTKNMMEAGFGRKNEICVKSVELWLRVLGYETGNLIAKNLPFGGFYIMGGLVSKNFQRIAEWKEVFLKALMSKPQHIKQVIQKVPLYLVKHEDVGMDGALVYAKVTLKELLHS
jgi:glucokinase